MSLFIRSGVVKSDEVKVTLPRLVENDDIVAYTLKKYQEQKKEAQTISNQEKPVSSPDKEVDVSKDIEAANKIAEAELEAKNILAKAEKEAQDIVNKAMAEMEELKQKIIEETTQRAHEEGFAEGYEKGSAQGYGEGKSQGLKEAEGIKKEAQRLYNLATNLLAQEYKQVDETLLQMAMKIAERILHASLQVHPELILDRIRALTLIPEEREGLKLYLSPDDFEWFKQLSPSERPDIPFFKDEKLKPGDCYLASPEGIFEANVEAELKVFEKTLREEIEYGRLEEASS